jgi:hypothetical protein
VGSYKILVDESVQMIDNIESKIRAYSLKKNENALTYDELQKIAYDYLNKVVRNNDSKKMQYITDEMRETLSDFGLYQDLETGQLMHSKRKEDYIRGKFEALLEAKQKYVEFLLYILSKHKVQFDFERAYELWLSLPKEKVKANVKEEKYISNQNTVKKLSQPLSNVSRHGGSEGGNQKGD